MTDLELKEAKKEVDVALNHFNWAEPDYIDNAIKELNAAIEKYDSIAKSKGLQPFGI